MLERAIALRIYALLKFLKRRLLLLDQRSLLLDKCVLLLDGFFQFLKFYIVSRLVGEKLRDDVVRLIDLICQVGQHGNDARVIAFVDVRHCRCGWRRGERWRSDMCYLVLLRDVAHAGLPLHRHARGTERLAARPDASLSVPRRAQTADRRLRRSGMKICEGCSNDDDCREYVA